jgi:hypothetical protein
VELKGSNPNLSPQCEETERNKQTQKRAGATFSVFENWNLEEMITIFPHLI